MKSLSARPAGTSRSVRRFAAAVAAGVTAVALLGGCGFETRQQAAAVVNGTVVHESDVQETKQQLSEAKYDTNEAAVLTGLIAAPLLDKAMASAGGWKPDANYAKVISEIPDATDATKKFVAAALLIESPAMTPDVVTAYRTELKNADISVNPKFGKVVLSEQGPVYFSLGAANPNWIKPEAASQ